MSCMGITIQFGLKKVDNRDTQSLESNLSVEGIGGGRWLAPEPCFVRYLIEGYEQGVLDDVGQFVLPGFTFIVPEPETVVHWFGVTSKPLR